MIPEIEVSAVKKIAHKELERIFREDFPDLGVSSDNTLDRLLDIELNEKNLKLVINSDGMNLAQKESLERSLNHSLRDAADSLEYTIYFKRKTKLVKGLRSSAERPSPKSGSNPYGLERELVGIPGVKHVIAVSSGKGGVGKSTVSINLAVALKQRGYAVGLLDADIYGPSAPKMLGLSGSLDAAEGDKIKPREGWGLKVVSFGFLVGEHTPVMTRGPVVSKALRQMSYKTEWGELDYLIIDLPPGTGDIQLTLFEELPIENAIVVTTPQDIALLDAHKGLTMFHKLDVPVLGVVENMSFITCSKCGHQEHLFGQGGVDLFASERGIPVLGRIPLLADVRKGGDEGCPIATDQNHPVGQSFGDLADRVLFGL
ncbi:MAG: ATPase [Zetaproteobacteria bacterium]|nr:ATPase [Pseudobdellovibrionaceae bacterium]